MRTRPLLSAAGPWTVLGLTSGASAYGADGADAALVRVEPGGFRDGNPFLEFLGHRHEPYPPALRQEVLAAAVPGTLPQVTGAARAAALGSWAPGPDHTWPDST
jgi:1,6-anhydro-N-acetylmuramate kinase